MEGGWSGVPVSDSGAGTLLLACACYCSLKAMGRAECTRRNPHPRSISGGVLPSSSRQGAPTARPSRITHLA